MHMESLEDDSFEEFKGGTLQINQDITRLSSESMNISENKDNELNANIDNKVTALSNIISIPKRLTESLWSCRNNNSATKAITSFENDNSLFSNSAAEFFTFRNSVVEKSIKDCATELIHMENDGEIIAAFLLTEITNWDTEKERLIILTNKVLFSIKYDFIALKQLEHKRIDLRLVDDITIGELVYPPASLVPDRRSRGVRLSWKSEPAVGLKQKLNPFANEAPTITLTSHPLFNYTESLNENQKQQFSMDSFVEQLIETVEKLNCVSGGQCLIQHKDIVSSTYLGLGSLIYNRNSLGFFKVRGKFSF